MSNFRVKVSKRIAVLLIMAVAVFIVVSGTSAEVLILNSAYLTGVSSQPLIYGQLYEITVSGVYDYGNAPDTYADAEWSRPPNWSEVVDGYTREADILDVVIDNVPVDWWGSTDGVTYAPHTFSRNHVYKQWYNGCGWSVKFHIADLSPWGGDATGDNEGSLTIEINPVPEPSAITGLLTTVLMLAVTKHRRQR